MSKENEIDWNLVSRIEAAYDHGMSWDLDAICEEFQIDKIKHIRYLHVGKWAELEIHLNDEGLQVLKDNGCAVGFLTENCWKTTISEITSRTFICPNAILQE